mmetsp:Transcript_3895/g.5927  ORF Transcript_3895/g.5927 Transcript_3895/m.5927 type:complete len:227 (+) Transcript_3895:663-1343(+)
MPGEYVDGIWLWNGKSILCCLPNRPPNQPDPKPTRGDGYLFVTYGAEHKLQTFWASYEAKKALEEGLILAEKKLEERLLPPNDDGVRLLSPEAPEPKAIVVNILYPYRDASTNVDYGFIRVITTVQYGQAIVWRQMGMKQQVIVDFKLRKTTCSHINSNRLDWRSDNLESASMADQLERARCLEHGSCLGHCHWGGVPCTPRGDQVPFTKVPLCVCLFVWLLGTGG